MAISRAQTAAGLAAEPFEPEQFPQAAPRALARPGSVFAVPASRAAMLGRDRDRQALAELLARADVALVTLTGMGGVGKTRLALALVAGLGSQFESGAAFVDLSAVVEAGLVVPAIAQVLGVQELDGMPLDDALTSFLQRHELLLVLDNFEQVLEAAADLGRLLAACPRLTVLVTSRAPLRLAVEHQYPLAPLPYPDATRPESPETSATYPAPAVFVARAKAVRPDFRLTEENVSDVVAICAALDGLPLALELAAARLKVFSPQALLARLDRRLPLLTGGARDLPARQQTLWNTIAWSYALLSPAEQQLFRRIAVFTGGFTLAAADAICGDEGSVLDGVTSLVDQCLLAQQEEPDGEPLFHLLATIHEFALEKLKESAELEQLRERHAEYFLGRWSAEVERVRRGHTLITEPYAEAVPDLRAALTWAVAFERVELGLRLLRAVTSYVGFPAAEMLRLGELLLRSEQPTTAQARGLAEVALANCCGILSEIEARAAHFDAATDLFRSCDDRNELADVLARRSMQLVSDPNEQEERLRDTREAATLVNVDEWPVLGFNAYLASAFHLGLLGRHAECRIDLERARALALRFQMPGLLSAAMAQMGLWARRAGDLAGAREAFAQALTADPRHVSPLSRRTLLLYLAEIELSIGDGRAAEVSLREALDRCREIGFQRGEVECLVGLAAVLAQRGATPTAATCLAAAKSWLGEGSDHRQLRLGLFHSHVEDPAIGTAGVGAAAAAGQPLSLDDALALALATLDTLPAIGQPSEEERPAVPARDATPQNPGGLSEREVEVLRLLAAGRSNPEIAELLVIARSTVERHVSNILGKIGAANRTEASIYAHQHDLLGG